MCLLISRRAGLFTRLFNPDGKCSGLRDAATPHFGTGCGYNGSSESYRFKCECFRFEGVVVPSPDACFRGKFALTPFEDLVS